jgi:hypothetical protein
MRSDLTQAFLTKVLERDDVSFDTNWRYFQNMAKYKYDDYQQFAPGMRFIERFAIWLEQFEPNDRSIVFEFIKKRLVFVSNEEMNLLVASCFPDKIKQILVESVATQKHIPAYLLTKITSSDEYKTLLNQSLFFGLSDGARTDVFRRANSGTISHEQIYQTYELSIDRARKMHSELIKSLTKIHGSKVDKSAKFRNLFLLDDFSASGNTYLVEKENVLKGKISALYETIFGNERNLEEIFDVKNLEIHVVLYIMTNQAYKQINSLFTKLKDKYQNEPRLHYMHLIPEEFKLNEETEKAIYDVCFNEKYYDKAIEDEHTRAGIQLGYGNCSLPLVLAHNCPNNSLSMLWSYEDCEKFTGLFPRIPRHRVL